MNNGQAGQFAIAAAIVFATVVFAYMFRYEAFPGANHKNRFTGGYCNVTEQC
jgi:hypothetical protein